MSNKNYGSLTDISMEMNEKPLFTLCYLLAFQVRKFIGLFEALKYEAAADK